MLVQCGNQYVFHWANSSSLENGANKCDGVESRCLHGWIANASKFPMPFSLLEYVVHVACYIQSKFSDLPNDSNTNVPQKLLHD